MTSPAIEVKGLSERRRSAGIRKTVTVQLALIVIEPTVSGRHDMERVAELARLLQDSGHGLCQQI